MNEEPQGPLPKDILMRMLAEQYPDEVAAVLRELGYHVEEPPSGPPQSHREDDPHVVRDVLSFTLDLLEESQADSVDVVMPAGEYWMGEATDEALGAYAGQQMLVNVHTKDRCEGRHCVLHNPSDHHMREWRLLWRGDRQIMERLCPAHGTGHPDPDDLAYQTSIGRDWAGIHGCCGCCRSPEPSS